LLIPVGRCFNLQPRFRMDAIRLTFCHRAAERRGAAALPRPGSS
jgi:hypothetical protein